MSTTGKTTTGLVIGCVAILCLALAAGGVFIFASGWLKASPTATQVPTATKAVVPPTPLPKNTVVPVNTSKTLLKDDFSQKSWGTLTDSNNAIEYVDNALNIIVYTKNYFVWSTPNSTQYQNVHMEVTVRTNGTDPTTAFGLMCDQQSNNNSFYYFAITPAGQYAIAKAASGEKDLFLTNSDQWEYSNAITPKAASYRIAADCGSNGTLTLYVDGKQVASVTDKIYSSGQVGVITWSGEKATNTNVSFDDYLLTDLP
jgi:hypothetical protein